MYHLGIVDFLQDWTWRKRVERLFKIYVGRKDPDGLSVMRPDAYQARFQRKMEQIFDLEGRAGGVGYLRYGDSDEENRMVDRTQQKEEAAVRPVYSATIDIAATPSLIRDEKEEDSTESESTDRDHYISSEAVQPPTSVAVDTG